MSHLMNKLEHWERLANKLQMQGDLQEQEYVDVLIALIQTVRKSVEVLEFYAIMDSMEGIEAESVAAKRIKEINEIMGVQK